MEVLLIRHGEPEWVRDGLSVDDPPLTERGQRQAEGLAERLADEDPPVQEIWVSPLRRAQQTAAPLAERLGLEPRTFDWLAEIGAPRWDGTPVEVVERVFAETWTRPLDELWDGLPGGESFRAFHRRVVDGLRAHIEGLGIVAASDEPRLWNLVEPDRRVAVVAHGGTNADPAGLPARASHRCRGSGSGSSRTTPRSAWSAPSPSAATTPSRCSASATSPTFPLSCKPASAGLRLRSRQAEQRHR